jgi:hypothetical protein
MFWSKVKPAQRHEPITWNKLVELEPSLAALLWRAQSVACLCRSHSDVGQVFSPFRWELAELAGFVSQNRDHPILGTIAAYQTAYDKLYDAVTAHLEHGRKR